MAPARGGDATAWDGLYRWLRSAPPALYPLGPRLTGPPPPTLPALAPPTLPASARPLPVHPPPSLPVLPPPTLPAPAPPTLPASARPLPVHPPPSLSALPPPTLPAPAPPTVIAATCVVCRGPVRPGFARCYQCGRHDLLGNGLLADAVVPISYAISGTAFAGDLWRYKSWLAPSASARTSVLALLLAFLHDHGPCVWRHAGMPAPGRLAVVPTGCGRPGPHPLLRLASPYLRLPLSPLAIRPGSQSRDLDLDRFRASRRTAGASVLLLDDSWVSGASAQSAAAALKLAGASHVAILVLGRHLNPGDPRAGPLIARLAPARYDGSTCAVHWPSPEQA